MTSAGDGIPDRHAAVDFCSFTPRCRDGAGSARATTGGRDGGQLVRASVRGHACPAARRGRYRAKAERADRRRRDPRGRIAPACQPGSLSSHPIPVRGSAPGTTRAARCPARRRRALDASKETPHPTGVPVVPVARVCRCAGASARLSRCVSHLILRVSGRLTADTSRVSEP